MITAISIISLFENNKNNNLKVFIFVIDISDDNRKKLESVANQYSREIYFIDSKTMVEELKLVNFNTYRGSYSAAVRFCLGDLLPLDIDRILYLDCDTLVVGDLKQIYHIDMNNKTLGLCYDCIRNEHKRRLNISYSQAYYNSGVILFDLVKWRKNDYTTVFLNQFETIRDYCYLPDQDAINLLFNQEVKLLPMKVNILSQVLFYGYEGNCTVYKLNEKYWYDKQSFVEGINSPLVYHFCGNSFIRPWFRNSKHPLKYKYDYYYSLSPWKNEKQQRFRWKLVRLFQYLSRGNCVPLLYINSFLQRFFILIKYKV